MNYIRRDMEKVVYDLAREYPAILVTGPRQVGKTTMLNNLFPDINQVTLDDLGSRNLARTDPDMFLKLNQTPVIIDEIQYAPELFSALKMAIDKGAEPGSFILTGSQSFSLMRLAQESLAGRVAVLSLPALSWHEISGKAPLERLELSVESILRRKDSYLQVDINGLYEHIWRGQMPALVSGKYRNRDVFYSSYIQTYFARDIGEDEEGKGIDRMRLFDFIRAVACRIGQLLNLHSIAQDVCISDSTAARWIGLLEKSEVIYYLHPYSNNLLKRTVKTPKVYFFDTGLVAYLCRYNTTEILLNGALNGAILENYAINEIRKNYQNLGLEPPLFYYHDRDGKEIDLVIEENMSLNPLEVKKTSNPTFEMVKAFTALDKASKPRGMGAVLSSKEELSALDERTLLIPIWML